MTMASSAKRIITRGRRTSITGDLGLLDFRRLLAHLDHAVDNYTPMINGRGH
jgi:hypothetical protein